MANLTPMMQQYLEIKRQYQDTILFFRLGDFYEMFFDDAVLAAEVLKITLTSRDGGKNKVPMCGVPYHASESYIAKLINQGYKVAICEQVEDPKLAKGIVKREVIRVITPGTVVDSNILDQQKNNYLAAICGSELKYGLAYIDISTGEFKTTQLNSTGLLLEEISRLQPAECIVQENLQQNHEIYNALIQLDRSVNWCNNHEFDFSQTYKGLLDHFQTFNLEGFGCESLPLAIAAAGKIIKFLKDTQKHRLRHLTKLITYEANQYMTLDFSTRKNLELTETIRHNSRKGSLLEVLDATVTAMGSRKLKQWVEAPLIEIASIEKRLNATEEIVNTLFLREQLKEALKGIYDLERLLGKIAYGTANARDLNSLKQSLAKLPKIVEALDCANSLGLRSAKNRVDTLEDIYDLLKRSLNEDPPVSIKDGGIIKEGFDSEIDQLRLAAVDGKKWIMEMEASEKAKTGIKSLKIGFNKVFGYYIEVTRSNLQLVPDEYIRKQTLANAERFITPELKEKESFILGAEEKLSNLEYHLFQEIRACIEAASARIQLTADTIAEVDVYLSLALTALKNGYCKPQLDKLLRLELIEARHPVVEQISVERFVANDLYLESPAATLNIITGPNMAGKSTYIRAAALICVMAQIGSFVPAEKAVIGIIDKIFARVGASDDLSTGQSTFMVEMNEVANILNNATNKSFIILDEVGRGTSTYDGISIAWAVSEYIAKTLHARTLFATHYHELTQLEHYWNNVKNFSMAVKEEGKRIIFLRKVVPGGADRSYGIHVAQLAGLPKDVVKRATGILSGLEQLNTGRLQSQAEAVATRLPDSQEGDLLAEQLNSFLKQLLEIDTNNITPIKALNLLAEVQHKAAKLTKTIEGGNCD